MANEQQRFSSRLATLATMAGLAIGLGNVWRFPYMMGQHGGSAFLLVYTLFMLALAAPALAAEFSLGRATRSGPVAAFRSAFGVRWGTLVGAVTLFAVFMAACYYSVVIANVFYSAGFAAMTGFSDASSEAYAGGLGTNTLQLAIALADIKPTVTPLLATLIQSSPRRPQVSPSVILFSPLKHIYLISVIKC